MSSVIFIHLGDSPVPRYYYESIDQVSCLSDCDIILVAKSRLRIERLEFGARNVRQLIPAELPKSHLRDVFERSIQANTSFRSGFWQYALERFLILEDAMTALGEESAIHLEGDVLLFQPATQLIEKLRGVYANLATTLDHPDRAVPGFFFVNNRSALERLNRFIVDCLNKGIVGPMFNDMSILAQYRKVFGNLELSALPVLPPNYKGRTENLLGESCQDPSFLWKDSERLGMIFDAAALGQYLGGTDPRNNPLDDRGFINEKSLYDVSELSISLCDELYVKGDDPKCNYPIASLHVHSKNISEILRIMNNGEDCGQDDSSLETPEGERVLRRKPRPQSTTIILFGSEYEQVLSSSTLDPKSSDVFIISENDHDLPPTLIESIVLADRMIISQPAFEKFSSQVFNLLTKPIPIAILKNTRSLISPNQNFLFDKRISSWEFIDNAYRLPIK